MKYFDGMIFKHGKQIQAFICAKSKKRALELLNSDEHNVSMKYFSDYWKEYGNQQMKFSDYWEECGYQQMEDTAMDNEGLWYKEGDLYRKFEAKQ